MRQEAAPRIFHPKSKIARAERNTHRESACKKAMGFSFFQKMRLTQHQQDVIRETVAEADPLARTFVFGSRAVEGSRGGDIDLLCFSRKIDRHGRRRIRRNLFDRLGTQKIDFIVADNEESPFVRLVMPRAIPLP